MSYLTKPQSQSWSCDTKVIINGVFSTAAIDKYKPRQLVRKIYK